MPLSVLLPVVAVGLVLVIASSWWWAPAARSLTEADVVALFTHRTGVRPEAIALSDDGLGAVVRHAGGVGAVLLVGNRPWVREHVQLRWEPGAVAIVTGEWGSPPQHLALTRPGWADA